MTTNISIEEAQDKLAEIIANLSPADEVIITDNQQPVAKLVAQLSAQRQARTPGNCKGMITLLVEDDEHLKDFEEYMS